MSPVRIVLFLCLPVLLFAEDESEEIHSALSRFNQAVHKQDRQRLASSFTNDADYRDRNQSLQGASGIIALFMGQELWTERTPPTLQEQSVKVLGSSIAFVDAQLVGYGSVMGKSSVPVVLVMRKTDMEWRIFIWRTL